MEADDTKSKQNQSEDNTIFAPVDEIRNIERVIDKLETVYRELLRVSEGMRAVVN
jgi:hypothetical protein